MFPNKCVLVVIVIFIITQICASIGISNLADLGNKRVVCYYAPSVSSRAGVGRFTPENINSHLCTHLIYAFGDIARDISFKSSNREVDIEQGGYAKFTGLKAKNKNLKTLLGIGGWKEGSLRFSSIASDSRRRSIFIKNSIEFLRWHNFDGLNLDWQFPFMTDRNCYASLIQELREEYEYESKETGRPRLLITITVPHLSDHISRGYDVPKLTKYVDWMNVLTYNYYNEYEPIIKHHSQLYSVDVNSDRELNTNCTINSYLKCGAERDKLVLGIPTYGRAYTLSRSTKVDIGSPAAGPGLKDYQTNISGLLAYYEICKKIKDDGWTVKRPYPNAMGPYAYKDNQWVGYDDEIMVRRKSQYVNENKLGGIFFWLMEYDDYRGYCTGKPYPLIEAAKEALMTPSGSKVVNIRSGPNKTVNPKSKQKPSTTVAPKIKVEKVTTTSRRKVITNIPKLSTTKATVPTTVQHTTPEPSTTPFNEVMSSIMPLNVPSKFSDSSLTKNEDGLHSNLNTTAVNKEDDIIKNVQDDFRIVCYYGSWAASREGSGRFTPEDINPFLCTHILYAFGRITKDITFEPSNEIFDIEEGGYARFTGLKKINKDLTPMLSLGGWNEGSVKFASIAADSTKRSIFIQNSINYLRKHNFEGLDFDWQFPNLKDRQSYSLLIKELREGYEKESQETGLPRLLLAITLPTLTDHVSRGYDIALLTKYVDCMHALTYNYHTEFEPLVNHHSQLFGVDGSTDHEVNANYTIAYYLAAGADKAKLVLGIPTYGKAYNLSDPNMTDIGSPAVGPGLKGEVTKESGFLAYYEICRKIKDDGWIVKQPYPNAMGRYAYKENQWVGYDDESIMRKKGEYVAKNNLGGVMFWLLEYDDFHGYCNGKQFPLIEAAKEALFSTARMRPVGSSTNESNDITPSESYITTMIPLTMQDTTLNPPPMLSSEEMSSTNSIIDTDSAFSTTPRIFIRSHPSSNPSRFNTNTEQAVGKDDEETQFLKQIQTIIGNSGGIDGLKKFLNMLETSTSREYLPPKSVENFGQSPQQVIPDTRISDNKQTKQTEKKKHSVDVGSVAPQLIETQDLGNGSKILNIVFHIRLD